MANTTVDRNINRRDYSSGAVAATAAAGIFMIMAGVLHVVQGLVALFNDEFYVYGVEYLFAFDITGWGWIHLIAGTIVTMAGFALFGGALWARTLAVILAGVSIIVSFLWLPYYPLWNMVVIAFDVLVIWALTAHGPDIMQS
jgi:hypothetical protein